MCKLSPLSALAITTGLAMKMPRFYEPGASYKVTRRCYKATWWLAPGFLVRVGFLYAMVRAALATGIRVHVACVMSNHYHLVVTDPAGKLGEFLERLNGPMARYTNRLRKRTGVFWGHAERCSVQRIYTRRDMLEQCAYVLTNPVAAACVRDYQRWPGLITAIHQIGSTVTVRHPGFFYTKGRRNPAKYETVVYHEPQGWEPGEFATELQQIVEQRQQKLRLEHRANGRKFAGRARCLQADPHYRPDEPSRSDEPDCPYILPKDDPDLAERIEADFEHFYQAYFRAARIFKRDKRRAVFPCGTYELRRQHKVRTAEQTEAVQLL